MYAKVIVDISNDAVDRVFDYAAISVPAKFFFSFSAVFAIFSSSSGLSIKTWTLDISAGTTWNDGFSVVEPIKYSVPFSRYGNSASCCVLLYLWISLLKLEIIFF